jgi:potassium efflux system protein
LPHTQLIRCFSRVTAIALLSLAWVAAAAIQSSTSPASGAQTVDAKVVESRLKEVESTQDYDEATKTTLIDLYRKTLASIESMRANQASTEVFSKAREQAPVDARKLRAELDSKLRRQTPQTLDSLKIPANAELAALDQRLLKEQADAAAVGAKQDAIETQLTSEAARPNQVRQRITAVNAREDTLSDALQKPGNSAEPAILQEARRWNLQAQQQALAAELNMLDQELLSQPMRVDLLKAQADMSDLNLQRINERIALLEQVINKQRRSEVEQVRTETETAQDKFIDQPAVVKSLAERNTAASKLLSKLSDQLEEADTSDQNASDTAKRIEADFRNTQQKLDVAGMSQALGQILLEQRRLLPDARQIEKETRRREELIAETSLAQIQMNDELRKLRDPDTYIRSLSAGLPTDTVDTVRPDLQSLVATRRALLEKSSALAESYLRSLGDLDYAQHRLIEVVKGYNDFLSERLLWVRSAPAPSLALILNTPAQVFELLSPSTWYSTLNTLLTQLVATPYAWLGVLLWALLLAKTPAMKRALVDRGKHVGHPRRDRFQDTLQALGLTLLIAAAWPILILALSWTLLSSLDASNFTKSLAHGLIIMARAQFYLGAFRSMCLPGGLAEVHFRWPANSLRSLRNQLSLLMSTFLPATAVAVASIRMDSTIEGALPRLSFLVVMASMSWFFYRLFGPHKPVLDIMFRNQPDSLLTRFRYLWMGLALLLPLCLVIIAGSGFLYTAGTLTGSLIQTLWLILGFMVVHQMFVRWLLMTQSKLAFEARRAALASRAASSTDESPHDDTDIEEPEIDLAALNQDSLKLLNSAIVFGVIVSLWFIWSDVLPAFGHLDDYALWHYTGTVNGAEAQVPVTVADMLLAILITVITTVAARRFPALLEIVLLKRVALTSGGRYTATTLSRYLIAGIGGLLVLSTVGASWSQVQWLAAALSVGIGFGLQEIVANFISGLIILFERPIRVGDVVTVGDTDGIVTRIQIRATTIRTWDRQELLVPNKEFITGRLLNWSLSDQITRIRIPVGVAYGSDVQLAMAQMLEAAQHHRLVLRDPPPHTIFTAFGDSTLNLELRAFVGNQDDRLPVISQLHEAIYARFNQQGIVIAFPQRDIHIDTSQPLDVRIHPVP